MEAMSVLMRRNISQRVESGLDSLALLERGRWVRKCLDLSIQGIYVEHIPSWLAERQSAILVSNYPSVSSAIQAVMKLGCRLPGERIRLKAISRPEVITQANAMMRALGVTRFIFPVQKTEEGAYRLDSKVLRAVLAHLDGPGNVLWLSITGRTRGNGLLEQDLRTGAALFAMKKRIPLVPMGLVTREERGRLRVVKVRFGEPILPPEAGRLDDFGRADCLIDVTKLAMCQVARLLPPGQRGDFEQADEKLAEASRRLEMFE